jgi:RES domain-containing protein
MEVYRILKAPFDKDPLSVIGSELYPGRWNQVGQGLLYTASHPALAFLETMVHFETVPFNELPALRLFVLVVDETLIRPISVKSLPFGWNTTTNTTTTQRLLARWIEQPDHPATNFLGVSVPSALLEMSVNYLFAPKHPLFSTIQVVDSYPLSIDPRLWRT